MIDGVFVGQEEEKRMKMPGLDNGLQGRERLALGGERKADAILVVSAGNTKEGDERVGRKERRELRRSR